VALATGDLKCETAYLVLPDNADRRADSHPPDDLWRLEGLDRHPG
jgi:hypothetical protein